MKKLIASIVFSVFCITSASADMGVNVGVSGQAGLFAASAKEDFSGGQSNQGNEHASIGYGSIFAEVTMNDKFMLGVDYVPESLESETTESARADKTSSDTPSNTENKIQIDFEDLTTYYVGFMLTDNFYAKAGITTVEVITNEALGTGGSYGNVSLDGSVFGVGYQATNDAGAFIRIEGNYMNFDGATQTNSDDSEKTITLKNLDGVTGKISLGKTF
tara:strand:+ start:307 stop:960 length:654 start_codon:yes stop_codon:yes gene_type:complete